MYIKVRVKVKARQEAFEKVSEDTYKVSVKEEPRNGWANAKVIEILKRELKAKSARLISGHTSSNKIFSIE